MKYITKLQYLHRAQPNSLVYGQLRRMIAIGIVLFSDRRLTKMSMNKWLYFCKAYVSFMNLANQRNSWKFKKLLQIVVYLVTIAFPTWLGPQRCSTPLPTIPVRPLGLSGIPIAFNLYCPTKLFRLTFNSESIWLNGNSVSEDLSMQRMIMVYNS